MYYYSFWAKDIQKFYRILSSMFNWLALIEVDNKVDIMQ